MPLAAMPLASQALRARLARVRPRPRSPPLQPLAPIGQIDYRSVRGGLCLMVALRIGSISLESLKDDAFATVLDVAAAAGGAAQFPVLFALIGSDYETDPMALMDELARLS